jgi:deoxyribodipyrimidine photolyase-like uncharacterized protein
LQSNPRIAMAYRILKTMKPDEKQHVMDQAAEYLDKLNEL